MLAAALSACDGGDGTKIFVGPVGPSSGASYGTSGTASIVPQTPGFVNYGCAVGAPFIAPVNLIFTPMRTVNISSVTLHLVGGASLGGPMVTFPSAQLTAQFGSLRVPVGMTRTFGLRPEFVCSPHPWTVHAAIVVVDETGNTETINTSGPLE